MVDCQRLGQSHGSFVAQLVTAKAADRDKMEWTRFEQDIHLEHQYAAKLRALKGRTCLMVASHSMAV